jgi:hypothetical protein
MTVPENSRRRSTLEEASQAGLAREENGETDLFAQSRWENEGGPPVQLPSPVAVRETMPGKHNAPTAQSTQSSSSPQLPPQPNAQTTIR